MRCLVVDAAGLQFPDGYSDQPGHESITGDDSVSAGKIGELPDSGDSGTGS